MSTIHFICIGRYRFWAWSMVRTLLPDFARTAFRRRAAAAFQVFKFQPPSTTQCYVFLFHHHNDKYLELLLVYHVLFVRIGWSYNWINFPATIQKFGQFRLLFLMIKLQASVNNAQFKHLFQLVSPSTGLSSCFFIAIPVNKLELLCTVFLDKNPTDTHILSVKIDSDKFPLSYFFKWKLRYYFIWGSPIPDGMWHTCDYCDATIFMRHCIWAFHNIIMIIILLPLYL